MKSKRRPVRSGAVQLVGNEQPSPSKIRPLAQLSCAFALRLWRRA